LILALAMTAHSPTRGGDEMVGILLVDDDEFTRLTLCRTLDSQGHKVVAAVDGRAALRWLCRERAQVDLVLTDIMMPDTDGLELIQEIHAAWPDLPIIAMSAGGAVVKVHYLSAALELGAREMLHKPCTGRTLARAITRALDADSDRDKP
jgi:two-component system chemotaxis response regulator CheY